MGRETSAEYLNDDQLGRVMDKLFIKGLDTIFLAISLAVVKKFEISLKTSHLDSSSFHVHGQYKYNLPEVIIKKSGDIKAPDSLDEKDKQSDKYYQISATLLKTEKTIDIETRSAGRFIIATNILEPKKLSNEQMISEYKAISVMRKRI